MQMPDFHDRNEDPPSSTDTPDEFLCQMERHVRMQMRLYTACDCYPEIQLRLILVRDSPMHMAEFHHMPDCELVETFGTTDLEAISHRPLACYVKQEHQDECKILYIAKAGMN